MHVANLKTGALAVQSARTQRRQPALVGQLRQRIGLVHHLRKLAAPEEELDRAADRLAVDQLGDAAELVRIAQTHPLGDRAAQLEKSLTQLLGGQLVDGPQAAVTQVIDVVHLELGLAGTQQQQVLETTDQVVDHQRHHVVGRFDIQLAIQAEATHLAQPVPVLVIEFLFKQLAGFLQLRRIARTQAGVDLQQRLFVGPRPVFGQRVEDQRVGHVADHLKLLEIQGLQPGHRVANLAARPDDLLARLLVHDGADRIHFRFERAQLHRLGLVKRLDDRLVAAELRTHRPHEGGGCDLARLVDAHRQHVFLGDVDLDPTAPLGNDPAGVQGPVALGLVLDEIHARAAVQLRYDDSLGAVDDELAAADHDGQLAQVDQVLLDLVAILAVHAHPDAKRHAEGQTQLAALRRSVARLTQLVAHVFEPHVPVVAFDGKHLAEQPFEPAVGALVGIGMLLQKAGIRLGLNLDQIGNRNRVANLGEIPNRTRGAFGNHGRVLFRSQMARLLC
jgi:hypothetical protein